ncbi:hypothetical protein PHMEG_00031282 [Phytophthora megakarya]|uniref:BED-type domain-containing protein n=1 Tax=Phytophthora megakarya TaxID=4795 RepID=A0A225UYK3_9STRA|nr:hypothetical protein PHMEG_00031282 [Phytophthora megakarya]
MSDHRTTVARRRNRRDVVWEHFEEVEARSKATNQPKARCNYCHIQISGRPKVSMIPHLQKCSQAPSSIKLQWQQPPKPPTPEPSTPTTSVPPTPTTMLSTPELQAPQPRAQDRQVPEFQASEPHISPTQTQLVCLELLRLKAKLAVHLAEEAESMVKVATYQAKATEAEFIAEKLAARIKLQGIGIPEDEIERNLPSL